ncbi:unnamed protein product [Brachionus calyciflorus]|uniref:FLYWCH-type domain-containing protein n=1 Tax=Brachionus calyciflorus TaxID=104777 RepID=A0A813UMT5_9BILA|nr:unnamed protein product [Brachionus calyciflorus]
MDVDSESSQQSIFSEEMDIDMAFNISFLRTETNKGTEAIVIEKIFYVFKRVNKNKSEYWRCQNKNCKDSVTTFDELGSLKNVEHAHYTLSNIEYNSLLVEIRIIERAKNEQTSIPKIFDDELANLVSTGVDHELVAAFLNSKRNKIEQKVYSFTVLFSQFQQYNDACLDKK